MIQQSRIGHSAVRNITVILGSMVKKSTMWVDVVEELHGKSLVSLFSVYCCDKDHD